MKPARFVGAMCVGVWALSAAPAHGQVQLCTVPGFDNLRFENCPGSPDDPVPPDHWMATAPNANYDLDAPECSPTIVPKMGSALNAPSGTEFIGVVNAFDDDLSGRLVHDAVAGVWPAGTEFKVKVFANRGRLEEANTVGFEREKRTSRVHLQLLGWGAGAEPLSSSNNTWSRNPSVNLQQTFANWGANGSWAFQTFTFKTTKALAYVSLGITGQNRAQHSYVAFDLDCAN